MKNFPKYPFVVCFVMSSIGSIICSFNSGLYVPAVMLLIFALSCWIAATVIGHLKEDEKK